MLYKPLFLVACLPTAVFAQLNTLAKAKGLLYFGSATDNPELTDAPYAKILSDISEFGQITPGNAQKWETIEPSQNVFSYAKGDVIADLAATNKQLLRCHTLVWHSQLPRWVSAGTWTAANLTAAIQNHVTNVVTHYKGKCYAWDVVNEALNEDGTLRDSVFSRVLGQDFIRIAFAAAAAADPTVKLYYNDYNIEGVSAKSNAARGIVRTLKAAGVKIDGVGVQAHFIVGSIPSLADQVANLRAFAALGVETAYTELDIRHTSVPATAAQNAQQTTDYRNTVTACLAANTSCIGITIWDFTDKYSWIPGVFAGQGEALPWDLNLVKKQAYGGIVAALGGSVAPTTTIATVTVTATTPPGPTPTAPGGGGQIPRWYQCGGLAWQGSGTCVAGTVCTFFNEYYSQCL